MNTQRFIRAIGATLLLPSVAASTNSAALARQQVTTATRAAAFDRQFIDMMVPHHQGAVAMARIALVRGQHAKVKTLARAIILAQEKKIVRMKLWRKTWYGSAQTPSMDKMPMLPGMSMDMSMMHMSADIRHLRSAKPFDKAFIDVMIPHHQMAIAAARLELKRGAHAKLKALARSIIADQQREIREMTTGRKAWYGNGSMSNMGH